MLKSGLIGVALLGLTLPGAASAAVIFNLTGVTMSDGSSLTGSLTTSDNLLTLQGFSISTQAKSSVYGNLLGNSYSLANVQSFTWNPYQGLSAIFTTPSGASLNLFLNTTLTAAGGSLASSSAEVQAGRGFRYVTGGSLVGSRATAAVPEPATWAMMLVGFGLVGAVMRRKQRQTVNYTFA